MLPPLLCCFILLESQYFCHACCFVSFSCTGAVLAWGFCLFLVLLCSDVFSTSCKVVLSTFASLLTMHTGCFSHLRRLLCLVRGLFSTENVLICNATLEPEIAANARSFSRKILEVVGVFQMLWDLEPSLPCWENQRVAWPAGLQEAAPQRGPSPLALWGWGPSAALCCGSAIGCWWCHSHCSCLHPGVQTRTFTSHHRWIFFFFPPSDAFFYQVSV